MLLCSITILIIINDLWGDNIFYYGGGNSFFSSKGGRSVQKGAKAPPFLWEKGSPANFKIPNLPTEFPFWIRYENTKKIPKGSYWNTKSVYNSRNQRWCRLIAITSEGNQYLKILSRLFSCFLLEYILDRMHSTDRIE